MLKAGVPYNITDTGPDGMYILKNSTFNQWRAVKIHISKRVTSNPDKGFLILSLFAGHGILKEGRQIVLTNEINKDFYRHINAEADIRAQTASN
jgi:hypothetical protein